MRRSLLALCLIISSSACVNLSKPKDVAECAATNSCQDVKKDGGIDGSGIDGARADRPSDVKRDTGRDTGPGLDGMPETGDVLPGVDGGFDPDVPVVPPDAGDDVGPGLPDVPLGPDTALDGPPPPDARDASRDVPAGACAPGGVVQPAGTVCRAAVTVCDVDETCDGVNADCPADVLAAAGKECRAAAGDCDIAETCSGASPECPADGFKQSGTVCRPAAGVCDVAESCTGAAAACPLDTLASSTTVCRPSTDGNKCDPLESCTGTTASCPSDQSYVAPAVPGGVSAVAGTLEATISWTAAARATGYNVKRSATSGSGYTTLVASPTTTASPYGDTGLTGGTTYYYVVSAINTVSTCESANSTETSATPVGVCTPPARPAITATPGDGTVTLAWAAVSGAVSYSVARSETSGTGYATLATVTTGTGYVDSDVDNGTTYYYVITASNGSCSSVASNEASASPACTPPAPPANLTAAPGDGSATLTWTASAGATSYAILRNGTGDPPWNVTINTTTLTTFTDDDVTNGTTYYYVVRASNGRCSSANSTVVSAKPVCTPPAVPTGVTATPGDKQVALSWTAPAGATGYRVSRNTTGTGTFTQIATPTPTNYTNTGLTNGTTYYYVVAATNGSCWSADSAVRSATPVCTPPSVPGVLTATAGDQQVTLSWAASTPTPASYTVQRKTGATGTYANLATPTVNSHTDDTPPLTNGTTYFYRVSASNGSCSSAYNTEASATPLAACALAEPGSPSAVPSGSVQVTLTWTPSDPAPTSYIIGRSTTAGSGYETIGTVSGSTLTYTDNDTGLVKDTTYYYEITGVGDLCTATSDEVSATTACAIPAIPAKPTVTNASGALSVTWPTVTGATAYTVSRSTSETGTYSAVSTNQTAATYTDPAAGLVNGDEYFYKVSASNANAQCNSDPSAASAGIRSCTIPTVPAGVSARRSGNREVSLSWTSSPGTNNYSVQRSTTNGSGYAQVGTATGSTYTDTVPSNTTPYYYVVTARSDAAGHCTSASSTQASVPACRAFSGGGSDQKQGDNSEWCLVTCDDVSWWGTSNKGDRTLYINNVQTSTSGAMPMPAKGNGGYAFYYTPSSNGSGNYVYWNYGSAGNHSCP